MVPCLSCFTVSHKIDLQYIQSHQIKNSYINPIRIQCHSPRACWGKKEVNYIHCKTMTKRVGVTESLPDGTCPDNGSPRLCLPDESNEEGLLHQKPKKKMIMIRIREGSVYQQMRRSGHTKRKMKVNHILLWMNRSHHKGKNGDGVILMMGLQDSVYKMSQKKRRTILPRAWCSSQYMIW